MRYDAFEAAAQEIWAELPAEFKEGVDGLMIERDALSAPGNDGIYTLGECRTEDFPSTFGGPETTRSVVVLYYGSFLRLSIQDPTFDWAHELHETITHEVRHHLESLASEDALEDFDYAVDQNFKRLDGELFDPLFFRAGEEIGPGVYRVEDDLFFEVPREQIEPEGTVHFEWDGRVHRLRLPAVAADVVFIEVDNPPADDLEFCVVVVAPRGALKVFRDLVRRRPLTVASTTAIVES